MPDKDLSNLPILDDIVVPGDAKKAVKKADSKVQNAFQLENDGETIDLSVSDVHAGTEYDKKVDEPVMLTESAADGPSKQASADQPGASPAAGKTQPVVAAQGAVQRQKPQAAVTRTPNIDALTEDILDRLMPCLKQLIREEIRQALQQHLQADSKR